MRLNLSDIFQDVAFGDGVQVIGYKTILIGAGSCIGDHAWLSDCLCDSPGRLAIGRKVLIGRGSVVGAASMLRETCPPFCVMVGSPARIIKYFDFSTNHWVSYNEVDFVNSREIAPAPPRKEYLEILDANNCLPSLHRFFGGGSESF